MSPGMLADSRIITKSLSDHSSGTGGTPAFGLVPPYSLFFGVPFERVLIQGYKPSFRSHAIRSRDWDSAADLVSTTLLKLLDPFKTSATWSSTKRPPTTAGGSGVFARGLKRDFLDLGWPATELTSIRY